MECTVSPDVSPPETLDVSDAASGLRGYLSIDSLVGGRCGGGVRMMPDVTAHLMAQLARGMTLKYAFLGIPIGGAKAGIVCAEDASREEKLRLLEAFGSKIGRLLYGGIYNPGSDMGTDDHLISCMLEASGVRQRLGEVSAVSGFFTGATAVAGAGAAATLLGIDLARASVAVEGFGKVGSSAAEGFARLGARVVAVSTIHGAVYNPDGLSVERLIGSFRLNGSRFVEHFDGAERIEREKLLELDVDVLSPCAGQTITLDNAPRVRARLVSPGANIPLTDEAEAYLTGRGTVCLPDFVTSSGGVLGLAMSFGGFGESEILDFISTHFARRVSALVEASLARGVSVRRQAEEECMGRFVRMKARVESRSPFARAFRFGGRLLEGGLLPGFVKRAIGRWYFPRMVGGAMWR